MLAQHVNVEQTDYGLPDLLKYIPASVANSAAEGMIQLARSDWAGEIAFLMAAVGLMNARNVVETVSTDYRKLNMARARSKKPLLFDHHIFKILHRQQRQLYSISGMSRIVDARSLVAGHWKI